MRIYRFNMRVYLIIIIQDKLLFFNIIIKIKKRNNFIKINHDIQLQFQLKKRVKNVHKSHLLINTSQNNTQVNICTCLNCHYVIIS